MTIKIKHLKKIFSRKKNFSKKNFLVFVCGTIFFYASSADFFESEKIDEKDFLPILIEENQNENLENLEQEKFQKTSQEKKAAKYIPLEIPIPENNEYATTQIKKYYNTYTTKFGAARLYKMLDEAEPYRAYVRSRLKEKSMPACLEYLPVVESEYKVRALSKSGAAGIWQFMTNSVAGLLKKNDYIDERFDPYLATDAALQKLLDNYKTFGDWPLAIAAYNCGAGAMARILKKVKNPADKNFWYLAEKKLLHDQSVEYVPKFLAISDLATNPDFYGIEIPAICEDVVKIGFDTIFVDEKISLRRLAQEMKMEDEILLQLNPALILELTPPNIDYPLRLPNGMELSAKIALKQIHDFKN